jgi:predicted NAD/FAD-dependent oxidoreductase
MRVGCAKKFGVADVGCCCNTAPVTAAARRRPNVAVIGGGLAGLSCANRCAARGDSVSVFDKARGPGGRLASRRAELPDGTPLRFHHGCPWFDDDDPDMRTRLEGWARRGVAEPWPGRVVRDGVAVAGERWVGVGGMSAPCKYLTRGLDYRVRHPINSLEQQDGRWLLHGDGGDGSGGGETFGGYDLVILAVPAPQAAALLRTASIEALAKQADAAEMTPQWALMLAYNEPPTIDHDAALGTSGPLAKWWRTPHKPTCWTAIATYDWTRQHLELEFDEAAALLQPAFAKATGITADPVFVQAHRWRYSQCIRPIGRPFLHDPDLGLALCGDWLPGNGVAGALQSGLALADALT